MRPSIVSSCGILLLFVAINSALPAEPRDILLIELAPKQESLHTVNLGEAKTDGASGDSTVREKRTIGFLRETFPTLSEIIDRKIQTITRFLFRVIGRLVLGGGGGGGTSDSDSAGGSSTSGNSAASGGNGRRIQITLPTFPPSLEDEEDEEEDENDAASAASTNDVLASASDKTEATVSPPEGEAKTRVARAVAADGKKENEPLVAADQEAAAAEEGENRDKRFLFGFGGGEGGSGSAGGSGNFLFDIIRGVADGSARAAGGFYRLLAGTSPSLPPDLMTHEPSSSPIQSSRRISSSSSSSSLIAGSGTTEEASEHTGPTGGAVGVGYSAGAAAIETPELELKPDDGYTSGIPGPITRLFVIANRGVSNLIQDLILRLAQTSERIVNFKARLITSII